MMTGEALKILRQVNLGQLTHDKDDDDGDDDDEDDDEDKGKDNDRSIYGSTSNDCDHCRRRRRRHRRRHNNLLLQDGVNFC